MISMIAATQLAQVTAQAQAQAQAQAHAQAQAQVQVQTQAPQSNGSLFPGLVGIPQMHTFTPSINCNTVNPVAPVLGNTVYNNNALGITPGVNPVVNPAFLNAIVNEISAGHNHQASQAVTSDKNNNSNNIQKSNTIRVNELLALLVRK